jgi:hypothetical protein
VVGGEAVRLAHAASHTVMATASKAINMRRECVSWPSLMAVAFF